MPEIVELAEAKASLSELVERAAAGEEVIIVVDGVPRAHLVSLAEKRPVRRPGAWEGQVWIADDFDDPLPPEILRACGPAPWRGGSGAIFQSTVRSAHTVVGKTHLQLSIYQLH